jgi:hypothetical protein
MLKLRRSNHAVHDDDADRESCRVPALSTVLLVALAIAALALLKTLGLK